MAKDIPIIFSAPMVRALLEGRKTMTRRILKPQPVPFLIDDKPCEVTLTQIDSDPRPRVTLGRVITKQEVRFAPGDRLWVRENFAHVGTCDPGFLTYQATYPHDLAHLGLENVPATLKEAGYKWTPCIHMPRPLSRLTLIASAVKIERLQDMCEPDAIAEGISSKKICGMGDVWTHYLNPNGPVGWLDPRQSFQSLWMSLHGAGSWESNPYVVALTFRVIKANIDAPEARVAA